MPTVCVQVLPKPASRYERLRARGGEPFEWGLQRNLDHHGSVIESRELYLTSEWGRPGEVITISHRAGDPVERLLITSVHHEIVPGPGRDRLG